MAERVIPRFHAPLGCGLNTRVHGAVPRFVCDFRVLRYLQNRPNFTEAHKFCSPCLKVRCGRDPSVKQSNRSVVRPLWADKYFIQGCFAFNRSHHQFTRRITATALYRVSIRQVRDHFEIS